LIKHPPAHTILAQFIIRATAVGYWAIR